MTIPRAGEVFKNLPHKYVHYIQKVMDIHHLAPEFLTFGISGIAPSLEVGESIPQPVTFEWTTSLPDEIKPNSITIRDETNAIDLVTGVANTGSYSLLLPSPITKTTQAQHEFSITALKLAGDVPFSKTLTFDWFWRIYFGTSSNPSIGLEAEVKALASYLLSDTFEHQFVIGANDYKYICYPTAFGTPTRWEDDLTKLNIPTTELAPIPVTNFFGQGTIYNIQRSYWTIGDALDINLES